ncbi:MAG: glycoside hydrolase family 127 protein [Planctomycetaceae bacterium]|nr:glycoside hydrolase family 127 protein [Planctomycetaceae bacterium]
MTNASLRKLNPVGLTSVTLEDAFWAPLMEVNRTATLPIQYHQCKTTGRFDGFTWTRDSGKTEPHIFWDSDVAKWIEAAGYSLAVRPDPELEKQVDEVVDVMAAAQGPDGYLNMYFQRVAPDKRWTNLRDCHELYCAGHLMEGAVAYFQATGKRKFLDVMCRYGDHIIATFGTGQGQKRGYPGHEEVELALVKLFRATGEKKYLDQATYFVNERGRQPHYYDIEAQARGDDPKHWHFGHSYEYCQAHKPIREQDRVVGHAVRAMYLYSGVADVAAETGDASLLEACRRLWKNVTHKQMYVTGGIGPTRANEGFTFDYDLPNESAYAETCASIALVFWAHRMLHLDPCGEYADVMERALYNGILSGVSRDGRKFFYVNPLTLYPPMFAPHDTFFGGQRQEWFGCACCPPNLARMVASLPQYMYSAGADEAWVHLYAAGEADIELAEGTVTLTQKTRYPWDGEVTISVEPQPQSVFTLALRIPGWCREAALKVNGRAVDLEPLTKNGYARIKRQWQAGDKVTLSLAMPVERVEANPKVRQDAGRVALQRGPVVYCLEEADNGRDLSAIALPKDAKFTLGKCPEELGSVPMIKAGALRPDAAEWNDDLYRPAGGMTKAVTLKAIPYYLWANRTPGEMLVWLTQA